MRFVWSGAKRERGDHDLRTLGVYLREERFPIEKSALWELLVFVFEPKRCYSIPRGPPPLSRGDK